MEEWGRVRGRKYLGAMGFTALVEWELSYNKKRNQAKNRYDPSKPICFRKLLEEVDAVRTFWYVYTGETRAVFDFYCLIV